MTRRELIAAAAAAGVGAITPRAVAQASASPAKPTATSKDSATSDPLALARRQAAGKSILLLSGWATHNIGDVGHTPGTLRYLTEHLPDTQVRVLLVKTNDAVTTMLTRRFPHVDFLQGNIDNGGKSDTPALQAAFDEADLVMQNSGMLYNRFWGPPIGILYACKAKNKAFGMYAESFDGMRPQEADVLPRFYSRASFMFTRDTKSLDYLRSLPITPAVLEFGPDGCFGIDVRDDATANAWMAKNGLEPKQFVCVILRSDAAELGSSTADADVKARSVDRLSKWTAKLIDLVTQIVRTTGLKVALVPEVEKEIWAAKGLILDKLPDDVKKRVVHRDTWWVSDEACSVYAAAHSMVAMEPHSVIMALANGTPAIHFFSPVHGTKAYMFRDIGLPEWLIDIDAEPVSRAMHEVGRIVENYPLAQHKVRRAMDAVNGRSAEMMCDVAAMRRPKAAPTTQA